MHTHIHTSYMHTHMHTHMHTTCMDIILTYLHKSTKHLYDHKVVELMDVAEIGHTQQAHTDATPYITKWSS